MIRANIAELKNRLSHYLRLVKGGEVVEIMDRRTPLARISKVGAQPLGEEDPDAWIYEMCALGLVSPPRRPDMAPGIAGPSAVIDAEICNAARREGFAVNPE